MDGYKTCVYWQGRTSYYSELRYLDWYTMVTPEDDSSRSSVVLSLISRNNEGRGRERRGMFRTDRRYPLCHLRLWTRTVNRTLMTRKLLSSYHWFFIDVNLKLCPLRLFFPKKPSSQRSGPCSCTDLLLGYDVCSSFGSGRPFASSSVYLFWTQGLFNFYLSYSGDSRFTRLCSRLQGLRPYLHTHPVVVLSHSPLDVSHGTDFYPCSGTTLVSVIRSSGQWFCPYLPTSTTLTESRELIGHQWLKKK